LPKNRRSQDITEHSDALDLESGVFGSNDPHEIAVSLKRSAEESDRRKSGPFHSAMSMLNYYVNRAGKICRCGGAMSSSEPRTNFVRCLGANASHPRHDFVVSAVVRVKQCKVGPSTNIWIRRR
jgi:hypothetical protein